MKNNGFVMLYVTEINTDGNKLDSKNYCFWLFIYYVIYLEPPRGGLKDDYRMT